MKVYIGIDWSEEKHQVCFMNEAGAVIQQISVEHSADGFLKLEAARHPSAPDQYATYSQSPKHPGYHLWTRFVFCAH